MRDLRKDRVVAAFSRAAATYDAAAVVQRRNAEQLAALVRERVADPASLAPFLEIGAGTGLLTDRLLDMGLARGTVTDVAPAMVDTLRERFGGRSGLTVRELDGERFTVGERFGAIVSASTFQWFSSLLDPLRNMRRHLNDGGLLAFCLFVDGTFRELRQAANAVGCPYPGHRLFEANEVARAMLDAGFTVDHFASFDTPVRYPDALRFLRSVRHIGSTNALPVPAAPGELRRIIRRYDGDHRCADGVTATYTTLLVLGHKRSAPRPMNNHNQGG
ncbi:MAG TPA: methyltransferase domain-containing protein [bacterium]|nr:methyltransferase domain-containing protein [bacterium]